MSPGHAHEWLKTRLVALLDEVLVGLGIDFHASGSVTLLRTSRPRSGVEGDASYYLTNIDRVRGRSDLVMGRDPAPDLMIEVVIAHPEHDALEVYRRLGVREVWVCRRHALEFLVLSEGGDYVEAAASAVLPFLTSEELAPWVFRDDLASDAPLRRQFRDWVAATLAPRRGGRNA